jgi:hypothetical protein
MAVVAVAAGLAAVAVAGTTVAVESAPQADRSRLRMVSINTANIPFFTIFLRVNYVRNAAHLFIEHGGLAIIVSKSQRI